MKISESERVALEQAVQIAERFGYGNLLSHIAAAWAAKMMVEMPNMTEEKAIEFTGCSRCLPIAMHKDIVERGEWDETGKRYGPKAAKRAAGVVVSIEGRKE